MENKIWILVADDEDEIRKIVRDALVNRIGTHVMVVEAKDGSDAASRLQLQAFDCIVTDLKMPRKDGGQLINAVMESQFNAKTPVIVLTGFPDESITNSFMHITMLEKPIRAKTLVEEVEKQLKLGRTDQRVAAYLLNDFLTGVQEFFSQALSQTPSIDSPKMKAPKANLAGEFVCAMTIKRGRTLGRFAVGFDGSLLQEIAKRLIPNKKDSKFDGAKVAKVIGSMLFNNSIKSKDEKGIIDLVENLAFHTGHSGNYKRLLASKGIVIEVHTEYGTAYAQALSGDETIMAKSA